MAQPAILPGATTIGLVCKDAVILASEKRVAYGYLVLSKVGKKVFKITDNVGAACAGLMADMQVLVKEAAAQMALYSLESRRPASVNAVAKLIAVLLFQHRLFPLLTQTIIGGVDGEGPRIYVLDPLGSVIEDKFACVGSGAEIATGVLESEYRDGMSVEEAKNLVIRSIKAAISRDVQSGDGVDFLIITSQGATEESIAFK
ncbi:MAG: proteasome endopeptidase complex, archaeal, beta subunit [Candidatus Hecatellales archaeon]|nr:MAG: proteasome endopeptidase complex, archaeal, beta subunit [Candidatus Hecatellales archaeon]